MDMEALIETMAFFPREITINAGDRIFFDVHGFHTITFPGEMAPPPLFVPEAEALGTPAAADGGRWVANPMAAFPSGPPVHDGASYLNSGLPDPTVPPFVAEFTAPGSFDYLCLTHPVMKGTVIVQEQGAERPMDQAAYDQQAADEMAALLEQGHALIEEHGAMGGATPADGAAVWDVVAGVGQEGAQVMAFLPDRLEISAGDTVRWSNLGGPEPHTVTFLGGSEPPELVMVEPQAAGPPLLVLNPDVMSPAGGPGYDGAGYTNSGWLQQEAAEFPEGTAWPSTWELTFDQPGEYPYYCVLHGGPSPEGGPELVGMVGTIVVS
jgi:plastocyanin